MNPSAEIIADGEARDVSTPQQAVTLFGTDDPGVVVDRATAVSRALMGVVRAQDLAVTIWQGGKPSEYLKVEAWTLLGSMVGVFPVTAWTKPITEGNRTVGWEARVEARTRDGGVVGAAEAMCMRAETTTKRNGEVVQRWLNADEHALRSMAQTRAVSKALASPLRFVATLAGFAGTPADEMPSSEQPSRQAASPALAGERPFQAGDPCPTCLENGVKWAKFREFRGMLQCNGKLRNGGFANHPAPINAAEAKEIEASDVDPDDIPF